MPSLLDVCAVGHTFGSVVALDGISFDVQPGEMFGLLGPNGAGKTTLLSLLAGLRTPDSGEVRLAGEILTPAAKNLKKRIGLVPQELALYPELTAEENLRFFGEIYRLSAADLNQRSAEILAMIGLVDRAHHRVATFSGGMQRRLNLGIALMHRPEILLLDEPTAGVDPQSRHHLFEGIRRLNAAGMTILYTSHYMEEVQALCPRIGIIDHGKLIACDSLPRLLARLPSTVRFRLSDTPTSWDSLHTGDETLRPCNNGIWQWQGPDAAAMALRLVAWCGERGLRLTTLKTETPTLEKVFLHLTGHGLRD